MMKIGIFDYHLEMREHETHAIIKTTLFLL